jgi:predicted ester cyclase
MPTRPFAALPAALGLALALLAPLGPAGGAALDASPAAATPCPTTTEAEVAVVARRYAEERWTDPAALAGLLAEDLVAHRAVGTGTLTAAEAQERAREFHAAFPDVRVAAERVVVQGDTAAVAWVAEGTHLGAFDGAAATGRRAAWEGIAIVRVACGRIAEYWSASDGLGLRRQLGIVDGAELADAAPAGPATSAP